MHILFLDIYGKGAFPDDSGYVWQRHYFTCVDALFHLISQLLFTEYKPERHWRTELVLALPEI